jgi:protein involved in polysaccharide export with SLBB domain
MSKYIKIVLTCISTVFLANCSQVLQNVDLEISTRDKSEQENFSVVEKTLTIKEARKQKNAPYARALLKNGRGENSQPVSEQLALLSEFPKSEKPTDYKIGVGDTITFSRLVENKRSPRDMASKWPRQISTSNYKLGIGDTLALTLIKKIKSEASMVPAGEFGDKLVITTQPSVDKTINSTGRIGSDGSILLLEVGRLEAGGKTLNELRSEVRNILIRNGLSPRFQMEISKFRSQKIYLTINSSSKVVFLDDQIMSIRDILTSANVGFQPDTITQIKLQRNGEEYLISLRDIYSENAPELNVRSGDHIFVQDHFNRIVATSSIVDHRGNVVFEGVGEIKVAGRSLDDLRNEIKNLTQDIHNSQIKFQIQITNFFSQNALLSIEGQPGKVIAITDSPTTLANVLLENGLSVDGKNIVQINLLRGDKSYTFTLDDLLDITKAKVYLQSGDRIVVKLLQYKENKVFILGGVSPQIFKINPSRRETLADILFTSGGVLSASSAKRSEVYLLRGSSPVVAYHLDAQSPTRLIVADAMELRPNDILYVAEQPIMSFNRTLATILPLRILLRDIKDENIP